MKKSKKIAAGLFFLFSILLLPVFSSGEIKTPQDDSSLVYYIPVHGEVHFGLLAFIKRGIAQALSDNADKIILGIDTFGGRVDAAFDIITAIETIQDVPVYAYVEDKAWSAGALIALSADKIIMRKGSSIGSAAPVAGEGQELSEKYISALRAKFQALAEKKGYPPNLAIAMVDQDFEVREVLINGDKAYLTSQQIENLDKEKKSIVVGDMVSPEGKLLNLSFKDAKKYGLADSVVPDFKTLLMRYDRQGAKLVKLQPNWAEHAAFLLTGFMVSSLLMTFGFMFLFVEFQEPGLGWAGILGVGCFILFFFARHIVHLAQWSDVLIFALGVALIILEIFVIPGFGIAGVSGAVLILISLYLALSPYRIPQYPWDFQTLQHTLLMIMGSLTASIFGSFFIVHHLHHIPGLNKIILASTLNNTKGNGTKPYKQEDDDIQIGQKGIALTDLRPVGRVRFGAKIYDSISHHGFIKKGDKVEIVEIGGNRILVERRKKK